MAIPSFTADHIGASSGAFEPQRGNNCLLYIDNLDGGELLTLALQSFPLPKASVNPIETPYMNEKRKFVGMVTWEDVTVVYNDYADQDIAGTLWRWFRSGHDPKTGKVGLAKDYKKSGRVALFSPEGSIKRDYQLEGAFITNMDGGESDMSSDEQVKLNVTLSIDKAIPLFDNYIDIYG